MHEMCLECLFVYILIVLSCSLTLLPITECAVRRVAATWSWIAAASKVQWRAQPHPYGACPLRPLTT